MKTTVVNIRGKGRRACDVYIGRPSKWGNPFKIGRDGNRETVIDRYRGYLVSKVNEGSITLSDLAGLSGKRLGCYCAPEPCHGDVLADLADQGGRLP